METKKHIVLVDLLAGNKAAKFQNALMHHAQCYEKGKQFAIHTRMEYSGVSDPKELIPCIKKEQEAEGGYIVFAAIHSIDGERPESPSAYFMEGVQSISTLQDKTLGWLLFKDALKQLGYEAETDERMHVTKIDYSLEKTV